MLHDKWLTARLAYLCNLQTRSERQQLLLVLADKLGRTAADAHILTALISAEAAAERAQKAREKAAGIVEANKETLRIVEAEKEARRILEMDSEPTFCAHDQELFNAAELLILAGLVNTGTDAPGLDREELLGALLRLAEVPAQDPRRREWKRIGEACMAKKAK